jgi:hypothetical protein
MAAMTREPNLRCPRVRISASGRWLILPVVLLAMGHDLGSALAAGSVPPSSFPSSPVGVGPTPSIPIPPPSKPELPSPPSLPPRIEPMRMPDMRDYNAAGRGAQPQFGPVIPRARVVNQLENRLSVSQPVTGVSLAAKPTGKPSARDLLNTAQPIP